MEDKFEEIRRQIHEIRNVCGPLELKLTDLQEQIAELRTLLKRVESNSSTKLLEDLMDRVMRVEQDLKNPRRF